MVEKRIFLPFSPERAKHIESVAIGGANIAGGVAAIVLGRAGKSVVCMDFINPLEARSPSCTGCGGLIQEHTAQMLKDLGVPVDKATRRNLDGYIVTLPTGEEMIVEAPMKAVYRGHGPLHGANKKPGLDAYILQTALAHPTVKYQQGKIVDVDLSNGSQASVYIENMRDKPLMADFFVGAFGHNKDLVNNHIVVPNGQTLDTPKTQKSTVVEFNVGDTILDTYFGSYARVLALPYDRSKKDSNILFAALIPKDHGALTMVVMGDRDITVSDTNRFISSEYFTKTLPNELVNKMRETAQECRLCACSKNTITTQSPAHYLIEGVGGGILVGDAGLTRLYKDGIGAAVITAEAAANAIVANDFTSYKRAMERMFPINDHEFAERFLRLNDAILASPYLRSILLAGKRIPSLSDYLIDPFMRHFLTGDRAFKNILPPVLSKALFQLFGV